MLARLVVRSRAAFWEKWSRKPFESLGAYSLDGALAPVKIDLAELVLAEAGWRCFWLGEGPPSEELEPLVDKLKPDLLVVSASSVTSPKAVARHQAELCRVAAKSHVALGLAGSGAWLPDPTVHRLTSFEDLRAFLVEKNQQADS